MVKNLLLTTATLCAAIAAHAQWPAPTAPQNQKVFLEEFTGIHCQFCPDGHKRANDLIANNPAGAVVVVNVHTGGYANPSGSEPDFRTSEGAAIVALPNMNLCGYPAGAINRHAFSGVTNASCAPAGTSPKPQAAESRSLWATQAPGVLSAPTYVNVAVKASLNSTTRVLTVNAQAYFTANSTASADNISILLVEDSVRGPQTGASQWYPAMVNSDGTYNHNHLLRKVLNQTTFGDALSPRTTGSRIDKNYTYTIPAMFANRAPVLKNLRVIAIVAQGNTEVMNAVESGINIGATGVSNVLTSFSDVSVYPNPAADVANLRFTLSENADVQISVYNGVGRLVSNDTYKSMTIGSKNVVLNTSTLAAGIYSVKIQTEGGSAVQKLTIVK